MSNDPLRDDSNQGMQESVGKRKFFNGFLLYFSLGLVLDIFLCLEVGFSKVGVFLHSVCLINMLLFGYLWLENANLSPTWLTKAFKGFFLLFEKLLNLTVSTLVWVTVLIIGSVVAWFALQGFVLIPVQVIVILTIIFIINKDNSE